MVGDQDGRAGEIHLCSHHCCHHHLDHEHLHHYQDKGSELCLWTWIVCIAFIWFVRNGLERSTSESLRMWRKRGLSDHHFLLRWPWSWSSRSQSSWSPLAESDSLRILRVREEEEVGSCRPDQWHIPSLSNHWLVINDQMWFFDLILTSYTSHPWAMWFSYWSQVTNNWLWFSDIILTKKLD